MARMHAHYLRIAIEEIVNTERAEALFEESPSEEKLDTIFDDVLKKSLQAALESSGPFCKLFVDGWCSSLSGDED